MPKSVFGTPLVHVKVLRRSGLGRCTPSECFTSVSSATLTCAASWVVVAQRGGQPPLPDNARSLSHLESARKLAGDDAFLAYPYEFFCVAGSARAQNNNAPDVEPTKLFDNVYAVGNSETTVYACCHPKESCCSMPGSRTRPRIWRLSFERSTWIRRASRYILLGHGHADHFGGARFFQETYGTKVATTAADWDLMRPRLRAVSCQARWRRQRMAQARPRRDTRGR